MILALIIYASGVVITAASIAWAVHEDGYRPGALLVAGYIIVALLWPVSIPAAVWVALKKDA